MPSEPREILSEYRLERVLHSTVWTTVIRAVDPRVERPVVIKLIHPAGPVGEEANRLRFTQLMRVVQRGPVRGVPAVLDYGFTPDHHAFLVCEPVDDGLPLGGLRHAATSRVAAALVGVLDTVDELAIAGVAHLNLSLDNVLVFDHSVRVVGCGTGAYLVGAPSRVWPAEGARYAAPELYGRGVLRRDDLWLADLYAIALMACDALGAEVEGAGTRQPVVRLDRPEVAAAAELEAVAAAALRKDPAARAVSLSEMRRALVKGVFGDVEGEVEPAPRAAEDGLPAPPVPASADAGTATVLAPPPRPHRARSRSGSPWALMAGAVAAALVAGAMTTVMLARSGPGTRRSPEPRQMVVVPTEAPTPVAPPPTATPAAVADPRLEEVGRLLADGDRQGARTLLDGISEEDQGRMSAADLATYRELTEALASVDHETALRDLRGGLQAGSIAMLRRAVAALSDVGDEELRADPDLRVDLEQARTALQQHRQLWEAQRAGDHLAVVERARRMIALLPDYSGAYTMREEAATVLEARAAEAAGRRDFKGALDILESLRAAWPERDGLAEKMTACRRQQQREEALQAVLDRALAAGRGGTPELGLKVLATAEPTGEFVERFGAARAQLSSELARMDAEPPRITLPADFEVRYRKNETVVVPLQVTDDHGVERVVAHVKGERDASYRELALEPGSGGAYDLTIGPEIHDNGKVLLWVEAYDISGHQGRLGDAENPLVLERKRWFRR